jgi:glucose/arabinose dehydrogenase
MDGRKRRVSASVCELLETRKLLSSVLTGTIIGTPGSYKNDGDTIAKAFDSNFNTFFDAPTANGNWVGLNLGTPAVISQIKFAPRATLQTRMTGGIFQGSTTADFSAGVVNLYTITAPPVVGSFTTVAIANTSAFQYVRYLSPDLSYGNVSELEFDGTPVSTGPAKLTGTIIGTAGSYKSLGNTIANAFDSNFNTFFDGPTGDGDFVGEAFGSPSIVTQIRYAPRAGYASRMVGGIFQGSNLADFSAGVVNLYTVSAAPVAGAFTTVELTNSTAFQYVRYLSPNGGCGNISELEFDGTIATTGPSKITGTIIGTAGSFGNSGNVIANAFDSNFNTFFDGPTGSGDYVGESFSSEALVTQIQYAPRAAYPSRMIGGIFQGSNNPTFASGVVNLYTITAAPAVGVFTTVPIATTAAYQYVRYLAPTGSFGDIAELEFDGSLTGIQAPPSSSPSVTSSSPANGATNVNPTGFISCALNLPNATGVDPGTMTSSTVYLYRTFDHAIIPTEVNTDAVGSVIVLQPQSPLDANTNYTFVVTAGVTDNSGAAFTPFQTTFTTGAQTAPVNPNIAFQKVALQTAVNQSFTCVTLGPDGNLYATNLTGAIFQFPVNADGTLGNPINLTAADPSRLITGVAFDPSSTAAKMTLWISSGSPIETNAPDFSGTISAITITGSTATPEVNYVTNLPRSNSNHLNDQPVFGPDGALYWCQGSNTSMGAPDSVWGYRPEHLLNAAILRLNIQLIEQYVATNKVPLDVQTDTLPAGQTAYNPYAAGAPLTIYATGIRNAYDLIWDSNGHLYAPTNGSAAGGNIPATPPGVTPAAPAENGLGQAEDDYLYDIVPGGYYGHPDPARGQYIFGGGNPINPAPNDAIQAAYPLGTNPDPNYKGFAYDFGVHYSPDGSIEYTGNAFGGALNGDLLITRYSGGKDVIALTTGSSGQITSAITGITGLTGFVDPVDITEDPRTGDLYVADLGTSTITLLRPIASGAAISVSTSNLYFNDPVNSAASPAQTVTISNTGNQPLAIPATGLSILGTDGSLFPISSRPQLPLTIPAGGSVTISIVFNPGNSALGLHTAQLQITSNDPNHPQMLVNLRAITTRGLGGSLEPSLQAILNLFQIPDNVGTADPTQTYFNTPPLTPNDEVVMQELEKAGPGNVTVTPLAAFSATITPSAGFGYFTAGTPDSRTQLFTVDAADSQSVDPTANGITSFDPGTGEFGIFASFDAFPSNTTGTARIAYSEDVFNTYDTVNHRKVRFYPLKNPDGSVVPNAFVFATEDYGVAPYYDSNDLVGIIRNVKAAPAGPKIGTENVDGTDIESAPSPTRFVFNFIQNLNVTSPNVFHNTNDLRLENSGSQPLVISSITSSNAFFSVSTPITYPLTIAAGSSLDLTLLYSPTHTGLNALDSGTLTIKSNDPITPTLSLQLAGIWQSYGNMTPNGTYTEPSVAQIVSTFGYTTVITNPGQSLNQSGQIETAGQEVLSSYWTRADTNLPITVQQLAAFHTEGNGSTLYWYSQGHSTSFNSILSAVGDNAQSLLPVENDKSKTPSIGMFSPSGIFGFNIDKSEFSDNTLNAHGGTLDQGHHVRFWPAYNSAGQLVPNTYIMAMDYTSAGENYDYNDNVYLISNMKPAPPAMPTLVTATGGLTGVTFSWTTVIDLLLAGYKVYRSTSSNGTYTLLTPTPLTSTSYLDSSATPGVTYYYTVAAVDTFGSLSTFTTAVSAARTKNTVPPAAPANLTASALSTGINLIWSANTETDVAGYNVYRATSATGTYFLLNSAPLTQPTYTDTTAATGSVSFYHVTAINVSGTMSAASSISATRPASSATPKVLMDVEEDLSK